ncbi:MAG: helix-turn-helix domain-containing protein [Christensenellales bacterium]
MRLKELRKEAGYTQEDIAKIINTSSANYNRYELEKVQPDLLTLFKLADHYGVSLDYLCGHKTDSLDISFYSATAKQIVDMLPQLNKENLKKLCSVVEGLILGQK